jgi:hypothetical protein
VLLLSVAVDPAGRTIIDHTYVIGSVSGSDDAAPSNVTVSPTLTV